VKVRFFAMIFAVLCFACSQEQDVSCESGFGSLRKDGREFSCPFNVQKRAADKSWLTIGDKIEILDSTVGEYYPVTLWNAPYMYRVKMDVSKKYFTEEQYTVSLIALDKNGKPCGEPKEFVFFKEAENTDYIEYGTTVFLDTGTTTINFSTPVIENDTLIIRDSTIVLNGTWHQKFLFFGLKEMPSHDWYHVLKVCADMRFILSGEI